MENASIIQLTKDKIEALVSGERFELKSLLKDEWNESNPDKQANGRKFKALVASGQIPNLKWIQREGRPALYEKR